MFFLLFFLPTLRFSRAALTARSGGRDVGWNLLLDLARGLVIGEIGVARELQNASLYDL